MTLLKRLIQQIIMSNNSINIPALNTKILENISINNSIEFKNRRSIDFKNKDVLSRESVASKIGEGSIHNLVNCNK